MNREHIKWMKTIEIKNLKDYILHEKNEDTTFVNIKKKVDVYLCEIIRFLILKSIHRDFKASLLSPLSKEIDDVWHCFLLHTEEYHSFVNELTLQYCQEAHFIHHNPRGAFEDGSRIERLERTKLVYLSRYNKLPSICSFSSITQPNNKRKREPLEDITEDDQTEKKKKENIPLTHLTIKVKDQNGEEIHFKITPSTKFEKVFNAYAQRKGMSSVDFRYRFEGYHVDGYHTPLDLDMEDDDVIDAYLEQCGC